MDEEQLKQMYFSGSSMKDISLQMGCSVHRVEYWMKKYGIERRSISDAIYSKHNPNGDPFSIKPIKTINDAKLMGLGMGLFWGEGNKADRYALRLGNSNSAIIETWILFLTDICGVDIDKLKFSLQIFSDTKPESALDFWVRKLGVKPSQFYQITVTISGSLGTYRRKSEHGVLQVYFHNKKLRDYMVNGMPT